MQFLGSFLGIISFALLLRLHCFFALFIQVAIFFFIRVLFGNTVLVTGLIDTVFLLELVDFPNFTSEFGGLFFKS